MSAKVSITLDEEVLEFVDRSSKNRSQFINEILSQAKKRQGLQELEDAYTELANNPEYQSEIRLWDVTVGDGLDAEE
jgi:metal-responsive CopG/Arc/MetJ family transcriptional regulator